MVNKKRGVFFALFFLVVLFGLFFVSAYNQCYMKSSPTASCETGYYDDGTMCCVNMESECAPHDNNCEDGDICTTDSCVLAMQDVGYTGEDYYVCYFGDKCSGQECDPNTGTCLILAILLIALVINILGVIVVVRVLGKNQEVVVALGVNVVLMGAEWMDLNRCLFLLF